MLGTGTAGLLATYAIAAVMTLKVEPGMYTSVTALLDQVFS